MEPELERCIVLDGNWHSVERESEKEREAKEINK